MSCANSNTMQNAARKKRDRRIFSNLSTKFPPLKVKQAATNMGCCLKIEILMDTLHKRNQAQQQDDAYQADDNALYQHVPYHNHTHADAKHDCADNA